MKKKFAATVMLTGCFLVSVGMGKAYAYDEIDVKDGGTIIGHVTFKGVPPKNPPIKVVKNKDYCGNEKPSEALIVSPKGGVKFAIAYLEKMEKGKRIDRKKQINLNQKKCVFIPHVFTITKSQELATTNSDPILHNANMAVKGRQMFNFGQPVQGMVYVKRVRKYGDMVLTCDSHIHMRAYAYILKHPYHTLSDADGVFTLDQVPPGKYTLKVWHESWKLAGKDEDGRVLYGKPVMLSKEVNMPPNGKVDVHFELM